MSMLESAGFSRSNPYYIVPQGRITNLTNQKDADRLLLLKEVAGTKVYEERRSEATKIMDDTNTKRVKIKDLLTFINDRLTELEEEKEELKEFQQQDRQRRSLEYVIYQRDLKEIAEGLETLEEERRLDVDSSNAKRNESTARAKAITDLDAQIATHRQRLELLELERGQTNDERSEAVKAKAQVECLVHDGEEEGKKGKNKLAKLEKSLEKIEAAIGERETELMEVVPAYEDKLSEQASTKDRLSTAETSHATLLAKQGRSTQFKTQKERDVHLKALVESRKNLVVDEERQEKELLKSLEEAKAELVEAEQTRADKQGELDGRKQNVLNLAEEISKLEEERSEKVEKRKDLWKHDAKLTSLEKHALEELRKAENTLYSTMDRDTSRGLKSVKQIAERLKLDGYYGPLFELFTVEDLYKTAVEVTAGTSLFQIVVDNDETATKILDVMLKEKSGRITFMPLNRLKPLQVEYPTNKDAIPMIKKLQFDPKYSKAMEQVFGRTIVCQSLEVAGAYTRSLGLNSITLDGDRYDRKGSLSGGYHDEKRSRLDAVKQVKHWQTRHADESAQLKEVKTALLKLDQEVTRELGQIENLGRQQQRLQNDRGSIVEAAQAAQNDEARIRARVQRLETKVGDSQTNVKRLKSEIAAYEAELKTKMTQTLSDEEIAKLDELTEEIDKLRAELVEITESVGKLAKKKNLAEVDLNDNLRVMRENLRGKIEALETGGSDEGPAVDVNARKKELEKLDIDITELGAKLDQVESEIESLTNQIATLSKDREKKDADQQNDSRNLSKQQKNVERYLAKKQMLQTRKDDCNKQIRELGVLPEEAFAETTSSTDKLIKKLRKVKEALKGFAHVNKKAYEQYTNFTKQRDELIDRQSELDESAESITDLISTLDGRKDEAIERTFKQVAKNFEQVFEKLVPLGRGRLIIQRREAPKDADDMDVDAEDDEDADKGGVESYTGVAIRVSFNSKSNEGLKIQQLSGGQKALVALALIFSIQKCDPAPFYLFDEIDANLDADRRTGVAAMINELSANAQYICTTFRPELIPHAESYFGVVFNNSKISNIKSISADECLTFVEAAEEIRA